MTGQTKIKFGWIVPPGARTTEDSSQFDAGIRRTLQAIVGHFDSAWVNDHFQWGEDECLESMVTLSFYAGLFPQLPWGTMVTCQSYRNPAYIAKMSSSIQYLTGGRLILGIGAGWKEDEYRAYGYDFPAPSVRLAQLEETVKILREMWSNPHDATFNGKYYRIEHAKNLPDSPRPPLLMVGGGGEKKTLPIAARYADWWNVTAYAPEFARKVDVLKRECESIGRDPNTLLKSYYGGVGIGRTSAEVERHTRDNFARTAGLCGTPGEVARKIDDLISAGCTYFMLDTRGIPEEDELQLLIDLIQRYQ